ncbi:ribosome small subunit-dependent GTPase A [Actinomycetospora lemnae]|uniref:Small ribosomal subunit biogenesis GTPase RsgA n=1 Tax=Actinomycetospora lemnae TaxID=3019891 RepID=A0ABT5SQJ3_9PSEU|nr:ribosome small subunit-dependent GTPase A [Actinomycetospora sp. DW7H6]MDD7965111.1 ribosome small subunit-dependent GTPase A [Actinomycetospora sp. DW7H6]
MLSASTPDHTTLTRYGWDDAWNALVPDGAVPGRVARVDRGRVDVLTADDRVHADPRGHVPAVGDWVLVRDGTVSAVLPRRTALTRATVSGRSDAQVLAANVDTVLVVVPLDARLRPGRVERLLALAWEGGATPVVVLTKIDRDDGALVEALTDLADSAPGVDVVPVSAVTGDGLAEVAAAARGTTVLVGPSGAGKSTLANALLGVEAMATGAVRAVDGKGRHTTVHRELLPLPCRTELCGAAAPEAHHCGVLVDTPGLRAVGVRDAAEGIDRAFTDVVELGEGCRFTDCAHQHEPGCAVQEAVAGGTLPARRLEAYRKLLREDEWAAARTDARLAAERRGRWKQVTKEQRAAYRARGY